MTKLLVSVRSAAEADAALRGGADWIDMKEPAQGALGPVATDVARQIVRSVDGQAAMSAAAGELIDWPKSAARELLDVAGVGRFKLGLSGCRDLDWRRLLRDARDAMAATDAELVAVIYADHEAALSPPPAEIASWTVAAGCRWLLVDTYDKQSGGLLDAIRAAELDELFRNVRGHGVRTAAAGRLTATMIASLPLDAIDVVAVRSAACGGIRGGVVCGDHVAELKRLIGAG